MPRWARKPELKTLPGLVVICIDADNLFIDKNRPFAPGATVEQKITWAHQMCRSLGRDILMLLFANMEPDIFREDDDPETLSRKSESNERRRTINWLVSKYQFQVVHCPYREGTDDVDETLIRMAGLLHREVSRRHPFVIVSEDSDYIPLLESLRRNGTRRPTYLVLPTSSAYPKHVEQTDAWGWLDSHADMHRIMWWLLAPGIEGDRKRYIDEWIAPHYWRAHGLCVGIESLRTALQVQANPIADDPGLRRQWIGLIWHKAGLFEGTDHYGRKLLEDRHVSRVLPYLEYYGFFNQKGA
ncbi:MAG: NYN domain-containing protein [bacterium]